VIPSATRATHVHPIRSQDRPAPAIPRGPCPADLRLSQDFRRAIEEIKLRAPIEDVVREYVPGLKKAGALWVACCPFHEEKTPSFKVDPRRRTWHCYGACDDGGDQISFVERFNGTGFMEAVEILAARTGVEVPRSSGRREERRDDPGYPLLTRAARFYQRQLQEPEGAAARRYLDERGLDESTLEDFGIGWAPANGQALVDLARGADVPFEQLERCGLARRNDSGRSYDFFRGRLMIPIRDLEGRTVGFGARRLGDDGGGPKYINTPETDLFKKNRLVYGLDLALTEARRARHVILVEGYTDVMAAHQAGLKRVGAVLGTSTTENHASLMRRTGARRISLVFDGDEAGSRASRKALRGLLPLEVDLHIVRLPQGQDPCDLLLTEGAEGFLGRVEAAPLWSDLLFEEVASLSGSRLSQEVDELLELIALVKRPVQRHSLAEELAEATRIPLDTLREQWRTNPASRAAARAAAAPAAEPQGAGPEGPPEGAEGAPESRPAPVPVDPDLARIFGELVGALLLDASLVPLVRPHVELCQDQDLARLLEVVLEMYEDLDAVIDASSVLTALGDHPARRRVATLVEHASLATSPQVLLEGSLASLRRRTDGRREAQLRIRFNELEQFIQNAAGEAAQTARQEQECVLEELTELLRKGRAPQDQSPDSAVHAEPITQPTH